MNIKENIYYRYDFVHGIDIVMKRKDEKERFYEETIILYERLQKRKCSGSFI